MRGEDAVPLDGESPVGRDRDRAQCTPSVAELADEAVPLPEACRGAPVVGVVVAVVTLLTRIQVPVSAVRVGPTEVSVAQEAFVARVLFIAVASVVAAWTFSDIAVLDSAGG